MSLSKISLAQGQDIPNNWSLTIDGGNVTSNFGTNFYQTQMAMSNNNITIAACSNQDYGMTNVKVVVVQLTITGDLVYEKLVRASTGDYTILGEANNTRPNYMITSNYSTDEDNIFIVARNIAAGGEQVVAQLNTSGNEVRGFTGAGAFSSGMMLFDCLSNGDILVGNQNSGIALHDRTNNYVTGSLVFSTDLTDFSQMHYAHVHTADDDIFIIGRDTTSPNKCCINRLSSTGTVEDGVIFYYDSNTGDHNRALCATTDSSKNLYVVWFSEDDDTNEDQYLLTKFNSSLVEQWTVIIIADAPVVPADFISDPRVHIEMAPDETYVIVSYHQAKTSDLTYLGRFSLSDGSLLGQMLVTMSSTKRLQGATFRTNSLGVAIGGTYFDGAYEDGFAILHLLQESFESPRSTYGDFLINTSPGFFSNTDVAITTSSASLGTASYTSAPVPTDRSVQTVVVDSDPFSYTFNQYW